MKVVLFCGGLGTRLGRQSETIPKPLLDIGYRPIIWHLMRYYAHYGHKDFILCLGYKGDYIKKYFQEYDEHLFSESMRSNGGPNIHLYKCDIEDWKISFVDTGVNANIAQRLLAVRDRLEGEEIFMANYCDGLTDLPLQSYLDHFQQSHKIAGFLCVRPSQAFHIVKFDHKDHVTALTPVYSADLWVNGGFFVFKRDVFDYIKDGEELVQEPFCRLIAEDQVVGFKNPGFWACVDTMKEKKMFDDMHATGNTPWMVWK